MPERRFAIKGVHRWATAPDPKPKPWVGRWLTCWLAVLAGLVLLTVAVERVLL